MLVKKEELDKASQVLIKDQSGNVSKVVMPHDLEIGTTQTSIDLTVHGDSFVEGMLRVSGSSFIPQLSGSLTRLVSGDPYVATTGSLLTITTASSGQIQFGTSMIVMGLSSSFSTTSTSPQSSSFSFDVAANEVWNVEFDGAFGCSTANGVQIGWAVPQGASAISRLFGTTTNATTFSSTVSNTVNALITAMTYSTVSGLTARYGRASALIRMGSRGGRITMLMGVVTSGTATMFSGSFFKATKI